MATIQHRTKTKTGEDEYNVAIYEWSEWSDVEVQGWEPAGATEPFMPSNDRERIDLKLLTLPGFTPDPKDEVKVPGYEGEFEVVGQGFDYAGNPFGWNPGGFTNLRKVDG